MAARKPFTPLAWVGSITAIFSLIAGIYAGWAFLSGQLERRRATDRLLADEALQLHASDYESAWRTLAQAATVGGSSARVQQAQEEVAIEWLDNIRISGDQTFASITEKLEPVLIRGAASAKTRPPWLRTARGEWASVELVPRRYAPRRAPGIRLRPSRCCCSCA